MRSRTWLLAVFASTFGCRELLGLDSPVLGDGGGASDTNLDALACYGPPGFEMCFAAPPTGMPPLGGTFDTSPGNTACAASLPTSWTGAGQPDVCLVTGSAITLSVDFVVTGSRPLALVAADSIEISATIDAASHSSSAQKTGPGGDVAVCPGAGLPGASSVGGGGGAGASNAGSGWIGGNGAGGINGGQPCAAQTVHAKLLGGESGEAGGAGTNGIAHAGLGGGAVYLAAGSMISIDGAIDVSGGGGGAGSSYGGGGGGGAGGMIAIYAPMIALGSAAVVMSNGGGGGCAGSGAETGNCNGGDPSIATPLTGGRPGGVTGATEAGVGCGGTFVGSAGQSSGSQGGGGGGGACGFILANQPLTGGQVSPQRTDF